MKIKRVYTVMLLLAISASLILYAILPAYNPRISRKQNPLQEYRKIPASADKPDMAALQNYYMTIDPELKRVPAERLYDAYQETKDLLNRNQRNDLDWIETGSNMGGRTRAILWDPNDSNGTKVWAGSITGGLWYNNNIYDSTSQWQCVNDFWPSLSVSIIVADPLDPSVYYAGTGEYQTARLIYRESSCVGIGIWKSTDGGEIWEIIPSTEEFKYISDLKIRIENGSSILYAGVVSGCYAGINHQSEPNDGLYRSDDGGDSWEQVLPNIVGENQPFAPADLEIGPEGRIFVGTLKNMDGKGGASILYSDEGTAGTWTIYDDYENIIQGQWQYNIPGRVVLACAPSDEERVYALVGAGYINSANHNHEYGRYILRSNNGGQSWNERNLPGGDHEWAKITWHAFTASVNPNDRDELFVGGKDTWRSTNSGLSWERLSDWTLMYSGGGDDYVHCDQHTFLFKENAPNEMLLSTDGGIFFTGNATSNVPVFLEKNNNYSTLQFYTCAIFPIPGVNYFVGGLQDNGTLLLQWGSPEVSDMIDTGDGAYCFFDDNEPHIMITSTYYNVYKIFNNWIHTNDVGIDGTGVFINPADYDSENNILYANAINFNGSYPNQILRISGIPDNPVNELISLPVNLNSYFSHVKVSPYSTEGTTTLFLGSQNGRLFRVNNAQSNPTITEIGSNDFPTAYLSSVAFGSSENNLLVTFSNYGVASVWQSDDGGMSWQDISGNLPDIPIRWSLYHPANDDMVMLATEIGIWTTKEASSTEVDWMPDANLPNVRVDMLRMRDTDNTVLAATHGRGLMFAKWDYDPYVSLEELELSELNVYPNPASDIVHIKSSYDIKGIKIFDKIGKLVFEKAANTKILEIKIGLLETGLYHFTIQTANDSFTKKVIVQ